MTLIRCRAPVGSPAPRQASAPPTAEEGLSTLRLSAFGLRRDPPRRPEDRSADYEALFDYDTLFYDLFRSPDGAAIIGLGPPLLNCEAPLLQAVFRSTASERPLAWRYEPPRTHFQPSCRFRIDARDLPSDAPLVMELAGRRVRVPVRPSGVADFAGRRILVTLSRDNPLGWIRDWVSFNVRVHGADAVLFYDNGSTAYERRALARLFEAIPGLVRARVVAWPFPFGPGTGPRNIQDSFYCQPGALNHARWRYCAAARGVLNSDIDELVAIGGGGSLFDRLERSGKAALVFPGLWVERPALKAAPERERPPARHLNCLYRELGQCLLRRFGRHHRLLRTKWIAVPALVPNEVDWGVHDLYPKQRQSRRHRRSWRRQPRDLFYRHFRQINTGWKLARWMARPYLRFRHRYDRDLADAFRAAFPDDPIDPPMRWFDGLRRHRAKPR
ncbi:MAG: hypothetical protein AB7J30_14800 [Hyphomicrobium sp.]|uniref:hypothetical protein n=1 Tax=Hyphomicrobium sp. TaxID=82 RepID=UPI003D12255C